MLRINARRKKTGGIRWLCWTLACCIMDICPAWHHHSSPSALAPVKDPPPRALRISLNRSSCSRIDRAKQILDTARHRRHHIHTSTPTITKDISFCASSQKLRSQKAPSSHQHTPQPRPSRAEQCNRTAPLSHKTRTMPALPSKNPCAA